ncbi:hypothetical protein DID88_010060 [Monilinia fructigena]|uniref:Uncharacterized protein n=1 Tax=Monilinia fructigena TaxID=38457 RepID=A0A395IM66_9HELO|nr:hypothetical protein DID88_010060 [Monilinia fructigena]
MASQGPISTPLTALLGIKHPIILAGMARTSGGPLAAAVSNAGGLGCIGGLGYTPQQLREIIHDLKSNLKQPSFPFGVDLALPKVGDGARTTNHDYTHGQLDALIDVTIEEGACLFISAVGIPPPHIIKRLHDAGILIMNMIGAPKHAVKALEAGVDIEEVVSARFEDTLRTLVVSGRPLRVKMNDYIQAWENQPAKILELTQKGITPLEYDMEQGKDVDIPHLMGVVSGVIEDIKPAGVIVDEMVSEAVGMLKKAESFLSSAAKSKL